MGLESIELLMEVEDAFGIRIPDAEASNVRTVGDLHALVMKGLRQGTPTGTPCATSHAFYRLRRELLACGIERSSVRSDSRLVDVVPRRQWASTWQRLAATTNLHLPLLRRPLTLRWLILVALTASPVAVHLIWKPPFWASILSGIAAAWFVLLCTLPFRTVPSSPRRTIGDVVRTRGIGEDEAWRILRDIVCTQLQARQETITPGTRFREDLGI